MNANHIRRTVDLGMDLTKDTLRTLFVTGDKNAHQFTIKVKMNGEPVTLTGLTAKWYFLRLGADPNQRTVFANATVSGDEVTFKLDEHCYLYSGAFALVVKLLGGSDEVSSIYYAVGNVRSGNTEQFVDPTEIVVTLDELTKMIEEIDRATEAASAAAVSAPYINDRGTWMRWDPKTRLFVDTGVNATGPTGPQGSQGKSYVLTAQDKQDIADMVEGAPGGGFTPVKGVDYWTEEDIAEIRSYVDEAILGGEW